LDELIEAVYAGPRAGDFIAEAVSSIIDRFLPGKPLVRSDLLSPPRAKMATAE